jgi:hypothetical protein
MVGKSTVIAELLTAILDEEVPDFLEYPILRRPRKVLILTTDGGEDMEMAERLKNRLPSQLGQQRICIERWGERDWADDSFDMSGLVEAGIELVVIDHFQGTLDATASVNSDKDVRRQLRFAENLTHLGIAVLIVHHSSEKYGPNGEDPRTPIGSSLLVQIPRSLIQLRSSQDLVVLTARPNAAAMTERAFRISRTADGVSIERVQLPSEAQQERRSQREHQRSRDTEDFVRVITEAWEANDRKAISKAAAARAVYAAELSTSQEGARQMVIRKSELLPEGIIK